MAKEDIAEGLLAGTERLDAPPQANPFAKAEREVKAVDRCYRIEQRALLHSADYICRAPFARISRIASR